MTKKIYLLRHCITTDSEKGINGSRTDTPLSENGLLAAKELVSQLLAYKFDLIIVSPLQRTIQTIQPYMDALDKKLPILSEPLTLERDLGIFTNTISGDGKIPVDQKASGKSKTEWQPKWGESCVQVYQRAQEFLRKIKLRPEKSILVCGHQNFLRCLELSLLNQPVDDKHFYSDTPPRLNYGEIREFQLS